MALNIGGAPVAASASLTANKTQVALQNSVTKLSSGKRIENAADDPSALAIAQALQAQVNGYDQAAANIQDSSNAATVASSALQTTADILQRVRSLAVEAGSGTLSASDKANLQTEASQLLGEINSIAGGTTFNGTSLLSGSTASSASATISVPTIAANASLASTSSSLGAGYDQGKLLASASGTATAAGTIELQVVNTGTSIAVQATYTNANGSSVTTGLLAPNSTSAAYDNVALTTGNFTSADVGATAFISVSADSETSSTLTTQVGANEGGTAQTSLPGTTTTQLGISAIDLTASTPSDLSSGAQDAVAQIDHALSLVATAQAKLGSSMVSLQDAAVNAADAATNLQASESQIRDLDVSAQSVRNSADQILSTFATAVVAQSNMTARSVERLFA